MGFSSYNENAEMIVKEISRDIQEQTEALILEQLNDLVSRGLLVIESSQPILVRDMSNNKIKISQSVRLTLKDKEYIETLEVENRRLKDILSKIQEVFPGVE